MTAMFSDIFADERRIFTRDSAAGNALVAFHTKCSSCRCDGRQIITRHGDQRAPAVICRSKWHRSRVVAWECPITWDRPPRSDNTHGRYWRLRVGNRYQRFITLPFKQPRARVNRLHLTIRLPTDARTCLYIVSNCLSRIIHKQSCRACAENLCS